MKLGSLPEIVEAALFNRPPLKKAESICGFGLGGESNPGNSASGGEVKSRNLPIIRLRKRPSPFRLRPRLAASLTLFSRLRCALERASFAGLHSSDSNFLPDVQRDLCFHIQLFFVLLCKIPNVNHINEHPWGRGFVSSLGRSNPCPKYYGIYDRKATKR